MAQFIVKVKRKNTKSLIFKVSKGAKDQESIQSIMTSPDDGLPNFTKLSNFIKSAHFFKGKQLPITLNFCVSSMFSQ